MGITPGSKAASDFKVMTTASSDQTEITVDVAYYWTPFVLHHLSSAVMPINASATAKRTGSESICVIALNSTNDDVLHALGKAQFNANGCAIYSNSTSSNGISLKKGAVLQATSTYSAGGYSGIRDDFKPEPITDSPQITDPLVDRVAPVAGSCDVNDLSLFGKSIILRPGTYCGGLKIGKSKVEFKPGIYVIKDGPFEVSGTSLITGKNVGFYFEGDKSTMDFGPSSTLKLSAPKTGPLAGILFFEDRSAPPDRKFVIRSKNAEQLEGTIYIPRGKLIAEKDSKVGQTSNWTAIVANQIRIDTADLQVNSDYSASDIPVPDGIAASSGTTVRLAK